MTSNKDRITHSILCICAYSKRQPKQDAEYSMYIFRYENNRLCFVAHNGKSIANCYRALTAIV